MSPAFTASHSRLLLYVCVALLSACVLASLTTETTLLTRQTPASPLVDFQVSQPILTPSGTSDQYGCIYTETLMEYEFANSYGAPFVGTSLP